MGSPVGSTEGSPESSTEVSPEGSTEVSPEGYPEGSPGGSPEGSSPDASFVDSQVCAFVALTISLWGKYRHGEENWHSHNKYAFIKKSTIFPKNNDTLPKWLTNG